MASHSFFIYKTGKPRNSSALGASNEHPFVQNLCLVHLKSLFSISIGHHLALGYKNARQRDFAVFLCSLCEQWRQRNQRPRQNIRHHHIVNLLHRLLAIMKQPHRAPPQIPRHILPRHLQRIPIDFHPHTKRRTKHLRHHRQNPRPRPVIQHRSPRHAHPLQPRRHQPRRRVLPRPEGHPGLEDDDADARGGVLGLAGGPGEEDPELAELDGGEKTAGEGDPVFVKEGGRGEGGCEGEVEFGGDRHENRLDGGVVLKERLDLALSPVFRGCLWVPLH
mmetsp:Transcript_10685/g.26818  ORF Transcript_10685/g.26818 Transcript_10685/m.26818 type:complete len:277 (+) Transcript_10685:326-1156(+)